MNVVKKWEIDSISVDDELDQSNSFNYAKSSASSHSHRDIGLMTYFHEFLGKYENRMNSFAKVSFSVLAFFILVLYIASSVRTSKTTDLFVYYKYPFLMNQVIFST